MCSYLSLGRIERPDDLPESPSYRSIRCCQVISLPLHWENNEIRMILACNWLEVCFTYPQKLILGCPAVSGCFQQSIKVKTSTLQVLVDLNCCQATAQKWDDYWSLQGQCTQSGCQYAYRIQDPLCMGVHVYTVTHVILLHRWNVYLIYISSTRRTTYFCQSSQVRIREASTNCWSTALENPVGVLHEWV